MDPSLAGSSTPRNDTECRAALAEDGKRRCLPTALGPVHYYADAACTKPVAFSSCAAEPSPFAYEYVDANVCARQLRIRSRGPKVDVPALFFRFPGSDCVPRDKPAGVVDFYAVGDPVPASEFVEAVAVSH